MFLGDARSGSVITRCVCGREARVPVIVEEGKALPLMNALLATSIDPLARAGVQACNLAPDMASGLVVGVRFSCPLARGEGE